MNATYKKDLFDTVKDAIENMSDGEVVCLWNEYCEVAGRYDDRIEDMDSLPELFNTRYSEGVFNLLNRFYFGYDAMDGESSSANPTRNWFVFNGYGNIVTTDYPMDFIEVDELAEYIVENENAFYNDEIQAILNETEEEEED